MNGRFVGGLVIGLLLGAAAAGMAGWLAFQRDAQDIRRGWTLKPAVVVSTDLPAGTVLSFDMLMQRAFPATFLTESLVPPEDAKATVGRKLTVALHKGDALRWSDVGLEPPPATPAR